MFSLILSLFRDCGIKRLYKDVNINFKVVVSNEQHFSFHAFSQGIVACRKDHVLIVLNKISYCFYLLLVERVALSCSVTGLRPL